MPESVALKKRQNALVGKKVNPYFQLSYSGIKALLEKRLNGVPTRIMLYAFLADRGEHKTIRLSINRVCIATKAGRNNVIEGLKTLAKEGFLVKVNDRGSYRLGEVFDKFIDSPSPEIDITSDDQIQIEMSPQETALADELFSIWERLTGFDQKESRLDEEARNRAESWAAKRAKAGGEPACDFRTSLGFFLEHGHEYPLQDGKDRVPKNYSFKGFMQICDMFLQHATRTESDNSGDTLPPYTVSSFSVPANTYTENNVNDQAPNSCNPQKYPSFIKGKDGKGKFVYSKNRITSARELGLVLEHSFGLLGINEIICANDAAMKKCTEDFHDLFDDVTPYQIARMVIIAREESKKDNWFSGKPFTFYTARTIFQKILADVKEADGICAEMEAERVIKYQTGELLEEFFQRLRLDLSYMSNDLVGPLKEIWSNRLDSVRRTITEMENAYGHSSFEKLPQDIIDGFRCLAILGGLNIPEELSHVVGRGPWDPNFDWCDEERIKTKLVDMWQFKSSLVSAN